MYWRHILEYTKKDRTKFFKNERSILVKRCHRAIRHVKRTREYLRREKLKG